MTTPATTSPAPVADTRRRVLDVVGRAGILIPFLITLVALAIMSPPFLRPQNLANILDQQSGVIIVAAAGTLVLIAGGIDLSVGAVYGLAAAVSTQLVGSVGVPLAILAGLGLGLLAGTANGVLVNTLVDEGYPSIGCAPCTTKPVTGADPRSGRWQGLNKTECGLHVS